jgi:hypothetical protein
MENYTCTINGSPNYDCRASQFEADLWCSGIDPYGVAGPSNCEIGGLETGETTWGDDEWVPANHVNYNEVSGEYEIEEDFVAALKEDGFAPLSLDSARLVLWGTTGTYAGYYVLDDVASGDLADVLGLQDGDIVVSVNGHDLNTTQEQLDAYQALKDETDLALRISRSSNLITINYTIVP